jgi:hypothetical protein
VVQDIRTISMDKSKYSWNDVDEKIKKMNIDRCTYVRQLIEKDFEKKYNRPSLVEVAMLLGLALVVVLIMVVK